MISNRHSHSWEPDKAPMDEAELAQLMFRPSLSRPYISPIDLEPQGDIQGNDHSDLLSWTLNVAAALNKEVFIDRQYNFTQTLEIPDGIPRIYGRGPSYPGLLMRMDWVQQRMRRDIGNFRPQWACATREQWDLGLIPVITHRNDCRSIAIQDLQIDGGQHLFDWQALQHDTEKYDPVGTSNVFRNSPFCAGLSFTKHNGRRTDGLVVNLDRVHIHDCAGSCLQAAPDVRFVTNNLTLGNSVSGRVLYYASGTHSNLRLYGFSRSSVARLVSPFDCIGFVYHYDSGVGDRVANPWPENDVPQAVIGTADEGDDRPIVIRGLNAVCTGSPFDTALAIGIPADIEGWCVGKVAVHQKARERLRWRLNLTGDMEFAGARWGRINAELSP